jgi:hypothetical protein
MTPDARAQWVEALAAKFHRLNDRDKMAEIAAVEAERLLAARDNQWRGETENGPPWPLPWAEAAAAMCEEPAP